MNRIFIRINSAVATLVLSLVTLSLLLLVPPASGSDESPLVTVAITDSGWIPYYSAGSYDTEMLQGYWPEVLEELFTNRLGWRVIFRPRPWARAQDEVRSGVADLMVTVPTPERRDYAFVIEPPFDQVPMRLFTYSNHPQLNALQQVTEVADLLNLGLNMVSNHGNGWFKSNIEEKGVRTQYVPGDEQIVQFLALKRADATIEVPLTFNHQIQLVGAQDKIVELPVDFGIIRFHLLVSKKSPYASRTEEIGEALRTLLNSEKIVEIANRYQQLTTSAN